MTDPELQLTSNERAELKSVISQSGFQHFSRLAEAECGRFDVKLKNLDPSDPNYESNLKSYHLLSKAASQFWVGLVQRVNEEIVKLDFQPKESKPTPEDAEADQTEELLS